MSEIGSAPAGVAHPAAEAWRALSPEHPIPSGVEAVRARKPTARCVYRLLHATRDGASVIAKRYRAAAHEIDRVFYRDVLPYLPVSTPRYCGELESDGGYVWIFLEDAGRQRFSPRDPEHRALAARWLGAMHVAAPDLPFRHLLTERGLAHYRRHLEVGRHLILDNLGNPGLRPDEVTLLQSVVALCEAVQRRWAEVELIYASGSPTLVHGDFRPRNVFVRDEGNGRGLRLLPIDWETAGWAVPAADLAPKRGQPQVDLEIYCQVVRNRWPDFDLPLARRLMWVGLVFRRLAAIEWAAMSLVYHDPETLADPVARLRVYHGELGEALREGFTYD